MNQGIMPGAIGIANLNLQDSVALAGRHGFASVMVDIREIHDLAQQHGTDYIVDLFGEYGVKPGAWGLPVRWADDEQRAQGLAELPALMETANAIGCNRATSGIGPGFDDGTYDERFAGVVRQLGEVATVLEQGDCRLGLEFIGTPSYRKERWQHAFIYDLDGAMQVIRAVGSPALGTLFDVWHHWVSGGTVDQIDALTANDVVLVHVNDAPEGLSIDEQIDTQRTLPMATGIIPAAEMLKRLAGIGFDGPIMPEPFSAPLDTLAANDADAAATKTKASMDALWIAAGFDVTV